jgi:hypothetical protein
LVLNRTVLILPPAFVLGHYRGLAQLTHGQPGGQMLEGEEWTIY